MAQLVLGQVRLGHKRHICRYVQKSDPLCDTKNPLGHDMLVQRLDNTASRFACTCCPPDKASDSPCVGTVSAWGCVLLWLFGHFSRSRITMNRSAHRHEPRADPRTSKTIARLPSTRPRVEAPSAPTASSASTATTTHVSSSSSPVKAGGSSRVVATASGQSAE